MNPLNMGDFWITMDTFQGLQDTHSLHKGLGNQLEWKGNLVDAKILEKGFKSGKFVKLRECFRMPRAIINHIDSEKVLPTSDLPKANDVKSLGVVEEKIDFPFGYSDQSLAEKLAEKLQTDVMMRGIHPGHCAIVFGGDTAGELFPSHSDSGGLSAFVQLVNEWLRAIPAESQAGHMLQISQSMEETLLYSSGSLSSNAALANVPLLSDPLSGVDGEATAAYKMERHAEVNTQKIEIQTTDGSMVRF